MSDQEVEDFEVDNLSDMSRMIPGLPPYDMDDQLLPLEPRSTCCCWAWTLLIVATNSLVFLVNLLLVVTIFAVVLLPTIVVVYFGFQCHSRSLEVPVMEQDVIEALYKYRAKRGPFSHRPDNRRRRDNRWSQHTDGQVQGNNETVLVSMTGRGLSTPAA
nr:transmembrane protein 88B isoform X2 [Chrysemys picta bellii]